MPELAVRNVEDNSVADFCPVSVVWKENKFGVGIDKVPDQPGTRHPIDFNLFASDPFHDALGCKLEISSDADCARFFIHRRRGHGVFNCDAGAVKDDDFVVGRASEFFPGNDFA